MSTIAAGYPDQRYYPYARTKVQAEELVRQSGLAYAIIRPTLVLGKKSPIWNTLLKIAKLPVVPLPEGDRSVLVQPVHVDDVVRGIALLLDSGRLGDEVLELGGPRPLMLAEFLGLVQSALRGEAGRIVRVPLSPVRMLLAMVEPALRPVMPVTAGQLAVFANDSTASENWLLARLRADMPSIEATIAALIDVADADTKSGRDTRPLKRQVRSMSEATKRLLDKECHTYVACLLGTTPSAYVREQYIRAAHLHGLAFDDEFTRFDLVALALARRWRVFARCADAYCALFHRSGALRRKLIVLAAILEHVPPTSEAFDRVPPRHVALAALSVFAYCSMFAVSLILGAVVLAPASILCWIANALDGRQHPREAR